MAGFILTGIDGKAVEFDRFIYEARAKKVTGFTSEA